MIVLMVTRCSSTCSRDARDSQRDPRRGETPRRGDQCGRSTTKTPRVSADKGRFTHNPEVAGSNPAPVLYLSADVLYLWSALFVRDYWGIDLSDLYVFDPLASCSGLVAKAYHAADLNLINRQVLNLVTPEDLNPES